MHTSGQGFRFQTHQHLANCRINRCYSRIRLHRWKPSRRKVNTPGTKLQRIFGQSVEDPRASLSLRIKFRRIRSRCSGGVSERCLLFAVFHTQKAEKRARLSNSVVGSGTTLIASVTDVSNKCTRDSSRSNRFDASVLFCNLKTWAHPFKISQCFPLSILSETDLSSKQSSNY